MKTALIFGANGLTGKACLMQLLNNHNYHSVLIAVRAPIALQHPKFKQQVINFNNIEQYAQLFNVDEIFCCLGTTIKKAKSKGNFARIDYQLVKDIAQLACAAKVKRFLVISSLGANANSKSFYSATKGKMEMAVKTFNIAQCYVFRPSLLLGEREEFRLAERMSALLFKLIGFIFIGPLAAFKPIKAADVAKAMITVANQPNDGAAFTVIENQKIQAIANSS
ncbi:NAD(P)H-binding protein [Thalassotalea sp. ND16A]|uniref:NAD(P)H-binding protein n=1 Tax=Thalassotalea sp. ND16A TaxID=1535422 RepID=UPI00051A55FB|nr:NAD(P)H-binding protein [Thalassotalea sp. ND16A]KGJ95808.1 hypothetical protein ND16A_1343 [Thalassotalea sp. ND16A]